MSQVSLDFRNELEPKKGTKIPFGIHSKCDLVSVELKAGKYVDINFADSEGRFHNKRLWYPNGKYPQDIKQADGSVTQETAEEAKNREAKSHLTHVGKVMDIVLSAEVTDKVIDKYIKSVEDYGTQYEAVVAEAIKLMNAKLPAKVNLKLIYDAEGAFSVFRNFPDYVEKYVDGQAPTLTYSKWEKENRCTYKGTASGTKSNIGNTEDDIDKLLA